MDKRRKAAYIEYNYEAAYQKKLHNLEEKNAERMLKEGIVKSLYATKEIRAGSQLEVEIYPEFSRAQKDLIPDEAKKKKQRQAQRDLNDKNSQKECIRTIEENFTDKDIWGTLTYTNDTMPATEEEADRNMVNYIKRLNYRRKKMDMPNLRYVYTTECSERGRWHHHIVLDGDMGMDTVESTWKLGRRNQIRRLQRDENGLIGMAMYITKKKRADGEGKYRKKWRASKNLRKPQVRKNHYKFKQKDVNEIVTGRADIETKLNKWYPQYKMMIYEVKYNTMNGRFYISVRMRRLHEKNEKEKPRQIRRIST